MPYDVKEGEDKPRTRYDQVPVVMILKPYAADWKYTPVGVGPPRTPTPERLTSVMPFAYAFLDIPSGEKHHRDSGDGAADSLESIGTAVIAMVDVKKRRREAGSKRNVFFKLSVRKNAEDMEPNERHRSYMHVDSELRCLAVSDDSVARHAPAWWKDRWRLISQAAE